MATHQRVGFRDVERRFSHLDGVFSSFRSSSDEKTASFTVELYPWWEHPLYRSAVDAGESWGFSDIELGRKPVTVHATGVVEISVWPPQPGADVIDWAFYDEHPLLWSHEAEGEIYCNSSFELRSFCIALEERVPGLPDEWLGHLLRRLVRFDAPLSLGGLPSSLLEHVAAVLNDLGVRHFLPYRPEPTPDLVAFVVDQTDYIIASDFEVEFPEWEHMDEWFQPS